MSLENNPGLRLLEFFDPNQNPNSLNNTMEALNRRLRRNYPARLESVELLYPQNDDQTSTKTYLREDCTSLPTLRHEIRSAQQVIITSRIGTHLKIVGRKL